MTKKEEQIRKFTMWAMSNRETKPPFGPMDGDVDCEITYLTRMGCGVTMNDLPVSVQKAMLDWAWHSIMDDDVGRIIGKIEDGGENARYSKLSKG